MPPLSGRKGDKARQDAPETGATITTEVRRRPANSKTYHQSAFAPRPSHLEEQPEDFWVRALHPEFVAVQHQLHLPIIARALLDEAADLVRQLHLQHQEPKSM